GVTMLLVILLLCITIILISDSINYSLFSFLTGVVLAIPFYKIFWVLKDFEFLIDKFFFKKKKEEKDSDIEINSSDENSEEDEFLISMMKMTAQKFKAKEYQSTILYSTKVLELYQSNEFFFALRGFAKIKTKEYQGALEDLKEALKLNPNKKEYQEQIDSLNEKLTEKKELPPTKHTRQ
ncbi:MAG: tetratricopeptide repeat protein, partial [Bacteroidota bacterium]